MALAGIEKNIDVFVGPNLQMTSHSYISVVKEFNKFHKMKHK